MKSMQRTWIFLAPCARTFLKQPVWGAPGLQGGQRMIRMKKMGAALMTACATLLLISCAARDTGREARGTAPEPSTASMVTMAGSPQWSRVNTLVIDAAEAVMTMRAESEWFDKAVEDAEAVLVFPNYFRLAYLGSVGGARGLLMVRDEAGFWTGPAFYSLGEVGGGLQIGLEYGAMVYVINDPYLVPEVAKARWQLDAEATVVVLATDRRHQTTELTEDNKALLFTDMDGLFAGAVLDGAFVDVWQAANTAFHGSALSGEDILLSGKGKKNGAELLSEALYAPARP